MRCAVFIVISSAILTTHYVFASYESGPGYGVSHSSYGSGAAVGHSPPPGGWGSGQAGGSYYHYHVPLVGQQSHGHYPPQQQQSHDHHLYYILPLLLLAALPLLLLPLLPLLLLPLGLSLLALLLPLLMMGGMMMMMMMMDPMMMMMRNRSPGSYNAGGDARNFGSLVLTDLTELMGRYARSLDLDHCAERISCEAGSFIFPGDSNSTAQIARSWMDFVVEQAAPKGKARRVLRHYKRAFWMGASTNGKTCGEFKCQPVFRLETPSQQAPAGGASVYDNSTLSRSYEDYYKLYSAKTFSPSNYYVYSQAFSNNNNNTSTEAPAVRRTVFAVKAAAQ